MVVVWLAWEPGYCVGMRRAGSWSSGAVLALACLPSKSVPFSSSPNASSAAGRGDSDALDFFLSRYSCRHQDPVVIWS